MSDEIVHRGVLVFVLAGCTEGTTTTHYLDLGRGDVRSIFMYPCPEGTPLTFHVSTDRSTGGLPLGLIRRAIPKRLPASGERGPCVQGGVTIGIDVGGRTIVYGPKMPREIARLKTKMLLAARRWAQSQ